MHAHVPLKETSTMIPPKSRDSPLMLSRPLRVFDRTNILTMQAHFMTSSDSHVIRTSRLTCAMSQLVTIDSRAGARARIPRFSSLGRASFTTLRCARRAQEFREPGNVAASSWTGTRYLSSILLEKCPSRPKLLEECLQQQQGR